MSEEGKEYRSSVRGGPEYPDMGRRKPVESGVYARANNFFRTPGESGLVDLVKSLTSIRPQLEGFLYTRDAVGHREAYDQGVKDAAAAKVDLKDPGVAPAYAKPSYNISYQRAYSQGVGSRMGQMAAVEMVGEHEKNKLTEGYDPQKLFLQVQSGQLAGVHDPEMRAGINKALNAVLPKMQLDSDHIAQARLKESTLNNVRTTIQGMLTPDATGADIRKQMDEKWEVIMQQAAPFTSDNERSALLLDTFEAESERRNGAPHLYDFFYEKGASGLSEVERNPALAKKVAEARNRAIAQKNGGLNEAHVKERAAYFAQVEENIKKGVWPTNEEILENTGPNGMYKSPESAIAMIRRRDADEAAGLDYGHANALAQAGHLSMLTTEKQTKYAEQAYAGDLTFIRQHMDNPEMQGEVEDRINRMAMAHAQSGATVAIPGLTRLFNSVVGAMPGQNSEPSQGFLTLARAYRGLPPITRDQYLNEDAKQVLDSYTIAVDNGAAPKEAFHSAYTTITPEAKERVQVMKRSPDFQKKHSKAIGDLTKKKLNGLLDFGPPINMEAVEGTVRPYMMDWIARNPNASEDRMEEELGLFIERNYVLDRGSGMAIQVPTSYGQAGKEMIEFTMDWMREKYGTETKPYLVYDGKDSYFIQFNAIDSLNSDGKITLAEMESRFRQKDITPQDWALIKDINEKDASGTLNDSSIEGISELSAKLRNLGQDHLLPNKGLKEYRDNQFAKMVENHKKQWAAQVATRGPSYSTPAKGDAAGLSDALQTAISGNSLWGKGVVSSKMEDSASALIMAREGLRTTAYDDPAKGAGKNIGFGYNLNQRSHKEIERDFKRAGINFGDLEGIRSGKVKISSDQARLLLEATVPQYVKAAQSVANGAKAGMWDELSNSQKAVLVDLAYQLGPGKLQKFKQSFKALMSGTADDLGNLFMVNYTDQTGKLVPDTRGHALRSAMYSGGMGGFVAHLKTNGYLK